MQENQAKTTTDNSSKIPVFSMKDMIDNGLQFGHRTNAANPQMLFNVYKEVNGIHLIDLTKTNVALKKALHKLYEDAKSKKRILFVSTNLKFRDIVSKAADKCGQYYVCKWRGGTLTNWRTIVASIRTLKRHNELLESIKKDPESTTLTKKEIQKITNERDNLNLSFGGIVNMAGMPDTIIVFSIRDEQIVIKEAQCVGTPIIGIADTNANAKGINYPIPGNDDSLRATQFYCDLFVDAILNGMRDDMSSDSDNKKQRQNENRVNISSPKKNNGENKDKSGSFGYGSNNSNKPSMKPQNNQINQANMNENNKVSQEANNFSTDSLVEKASANPAHPEQPTPAQPSPNPEPSPAPLPEKGPSQPLPEEPDHSYPAPSQPIPEQHNNEEPKAGVLNS